jgi:hypothetical protein
MFLGICLLVVPPTLKESVREQAESPKLTEITGTDLFASPSWNSNTVSVLGFRLGMSRSDAFTTAKNGGLRLSESKPPGEGRCNSNRCDVEVMRGSYVGVSLEFDAENHVSQIDVILTPRDAAPEIKRVAVTKRFKGETYDFFNRYSEELRLRLLGEGVLVKKEIGSPPKVPVMHVAYRYPKRGLEIHALIDESAPKAPVDIDLTVSFVRPI